MLREQISAEAHHRCEYCQTSRRLVGMPLVIDPAAGELVALFNPRTQNWSHHFSWANGGTHIVGNTSTGRATVLALRLNNEYVVEARSLWIARNWHPPSD